MSFSKCNATSVHFMLLLHAFTHLPTVLLTLQWGGGHSQSAERNRAQFWPLDFKLDVSLNPKPETLNSKL